MWTVLLEGELADVNSRSLGCMMSEKVNQEVNMIKNHGFGFNCGISLRRVGGPLSLA